MSDTETETGQPDPVGQRDMMRPIHRAILDIGRDKKRAVSMIVDGLAMVACLYAAIALRYGQWDFPQPGKITAMWEIPLPVSR